MSLSNQDIKKVSRLARVKINDDEINEAGQKISKIVDWFEQLNQVDTDEVEILTNVNNQTLRLQKDEVNDGDIVDDVLKNSKDAKYGYFSVPKVLS